MYLWQRTCADLLGFFPGLGNEWKESIERPWLLDEKRSRQADKVG